MSEPTHVDVAAYALGGLDQDEDEEFRTHLDECPTCWAELERMVDVTSLLSSLDPQDVLGEQEKPAPRVLDGMLDEVRSTRRQTRYRTLVAAAAAVAAIVGGPIFAAQGLGSGEDSPRASQSASPLPASPVPDLRGSVFGAADAVTGVTARVGLEKKAWGTNVGLQLRGVTGPLKCQLIAVSKTGERQVVTTWAVPLKGYGVPTNMAPLATGGGAAMNPADITKMEVRTLGDTLLVTVPVATAA